MYTITGRSCMSAVVYSNQMYHYDGTEPQSLYTNRNIHSNSRSFAFTPVMQYANLPQTQYSCTSFCDTECKELETPTFDGYDKWETFISFFEEIAEYCQ